MKAIMTMAEDIHIQMLPQQISLKHDDVKNQNKPVALCIVGSTG